MSMTIEDFANELNGLINERDKLKIKLNEIIERNNKNVEELIKYKLKEWEQKSEKELVNVIRNKLKLMQIVCMHQSTYMTT